MMISRETLKLMKHQNLLIVSSKQNMIAYTMLNNHIQKLLEFNVFPLPYSDNEGHFRTRSKGKTMKSGSVRETNNNEIIRSFLKEFKKQIKNIKIATYDNIFLFCPSYMKNHIIEALPVKFNKKLKHIIEGNYYSKEPKFLLNKITALEVSNKTPLNPEAKKILKKSNRARKVIKGKPN